MVVGYFVITKVINTNLGLTTGTENLSQTESISYPSPFVTIESANSADFPTGTKILIAGTDGTVEMDNFFSKAEKYWPSARQLLIKETDKYTLIFQRDTGEFDFMLKAGVQTDEVPGIIDSMLRVLNIGKNEVCKLKFIYRAEYVGDQETNLGLLPLCASVLK